MSYSFNREILIALILSVFTVLHAWDFHSVWLLLFMYPILNACSQTIDMAVDKAICGIHSQQKHRRPRLACPPVLFDQDHHCLIYCHCTNVCSILMFAILAQALISANKMIRKKIKSAI